jgi:hypothetical protein
VATVFNPAPSLDINVAPGIALELMINLIVGFVATFVTTNMSVLINRAYQAAHLGSFPAIINVSIQRRIISIVQLVILPAIRAHFANYRSVRQTNANNLAKYFVQLSGDVHRRTRIGRIVVNAA